MANYHFFVFQIDEEHNATDWWDGGGRELWNEAQTRAGNVNRRQDLSCPLAIPVPDTFDIFARFSDAPGWIDTEPLLVTEIETDTKEEAVDRMTDLGVTRANLRALDLAEEDEEKEDAAEIDPEEFGAAMRVLTTVYHTNAKKGQIQGTVFFDEVHKEPFICLIGPAGKVIERGSEFATEITLNTLTGMMASEQAEE